MIFIFIPESLPQVKNSIPHIDQSQMMLILHILIYPQIKKKKGTIKIIN